MCTSWDRKAGCAPSARIAVTYASPFGPGLLVWINGFLAEHRLPDRRRPPACRPEATPAGARRLARRLELYFSGLPASFEFSALPLDRSGWTAFQERVAGALAAVPYGETRSYADLAASAGYERAWRAVGNFMAQNPYPVILPCHRIIRSGGGLGEYSAGAGWKKRLLKLEGVL